MRVPLEVTKLPARSKSGRPLISMTSSGIGGVNGHAVIEGPPHRVANAADGSRHQGPVLFMSGGLSPCSAQQVAVDLSALIAQNKHDQGSLALVYGRRARQMTWRTYAVWKPGMTTVEFPPPRFVPRSRSPLVFVFPGQGPQHIESTLFHLFIQ